MMRQMNIMDNSDRRPSHLKPSQMMAVLGGWRREGRQKPALIATEL